MGSVALLCMLLGFAPATSEPAPTSDPSAAVGADPRVPSTSGRAKEPALPLPGPPSDRAPPGAATARPGDARKLRMRRVEPEDVALFVPRAVLTVPRFVLTGVFMPVSQFMSLFDDRAVARMRRAFYWNRAETLGWRPTFAFQGGYGFSVGPRIAHNDLAGNGETIEADALFGGVYFQAYQLRAYGDRLGGSRIWLDVRGRYDASPRLVFQGIGNPGNARAGETDLGPRDADVRTRY